MNEASEFIWVVLTPFAWLAGVVVCAVASVRRRRLSWHLFTTACLCMLLHHWITIMWNPGCVITEPLSQETIRWVGISGLLFSVSPFFLVGGMLVLWRENREAPNHTSDVIVAKRAETSK